jgi:hypothetical protein
MPDIRIPSAMPKVHEARQGKIITVTGNVIRMVCILFDVLSRLYAIKEICC